MKKNLILLGLIALSISIDTIQAQISPVKRGIGPVIPNKGNDKIHHGKGPVVHSGHPMLQAAIENKDFANMSTLEAIEAIPQLKRFANLLEEHGLKDLVESENVTVIAPTNTAFTKIQLRLVGKTDAEIKNILKNHVIIKNKGIAILRPTLILTKDGKQVSWNTLKEKAIAENIETKNGTIHIVDEVILP